MSFYISRFKGLESQEYEVEIVTPLFLGGADPKKAELRAPSIKGALRFWWRALYGSDDLEDMKRREAEIFGSPEGKSAVIIQLVNITECKPVLNNIPRGRTFTIHSSSRNKDMTLGIIDYLAYGLHKYQKGQGNVYIKEHIQPREKFKIRLFLKHNNFEQVLTAFNILIGYGGLGARSRNGFGSVTVDKTQTALNISGNIKSFSAISEKSNLFSSFPQRTTWIDALSDIGIAYREARLSLEPKHQSNKRILVAKPLPPMINDRHAKPYFLHVNKLTKGKYQGQILFLPYNYHEQAKRKEYFQTCEKMNQKISKLSGGVK